MTKPILRSIFDQHSGKVSDKWECYLDVYERIFSAFSNKPIRLLEIGVQNGGSLEIWSKYFLQAKKIVGVDVDPVVGELVFKDPRISAYIVDATDCEAFNATVSRDENYHIIIDDGSHFSNDVIKSFLHLFPRLEHNGIYIVEDVHCSYFNDYEGGLFLGDTQMSFFKRLADITNHEHWENNLLPQEALKSFINKLGLHSPSMSWLDEIHAVTFSNSLIIIEKALSDKNKLQRQLVTGTEEKVVGGRLELNGRYYEKKYFDSQNAIDMGPYDGLFPEEAANVLLNKCNVLSDENNSLSTQVERIQARSIVLDKENQDCVAQIERMKGRCDSLDQDNQRLIAQITRSHEVAVSLDNENKIVISKLKREEDKNHSLEKKNREINDQLEYVTDDFISLEKEHLGIGENLAMLEGRYASLMEENQGLKENLAQYEERSVALKNKIREMRKSGSWRVTRPIRGVWRFHLRFWSGVARKLKSLANVNNIVELASPVDDLEPIENGPLISVIIPCYNTPAQYLHEAIASVRNQAYQNWQLILVDDCSSEKYVRKIIKKHAHADPRIFPVFRKDNGNISAATNSGLAKAEGEYFTILDHDDRLSADALYWVAKEILDNADADYIYSDEDKLSEDGLTTFGPFYKPDWSPEYMLSMMYTCHMSVFRTSLVKEVGGYRSEFNGAQDYDLTLRVVAKTEKVYHIPKLLYHWRIWENSTAQSLDAKPYAVERQINALKSYLDSLNENYEITGSILPGHHCVKFLPRKSDLISIVIPTANGKITIDGRTENHIDAVIDGIVKKSSYKNYEIVVVHNGNLTKKQTRKFEKLGIVRLEHYREESFSLANKINQGCRAAKGEYVLILNDDIRVITPDWLERMLGAAHREGVGVVGAKLLFPNRTIQHAGVVILGGCPGHPYYEEPEDVHGYALGAAVDRNYIAVTGACQLVSKELFFKVGGYSDRFPLNYNDVDFCLKLHKLGYRAISLTNVKLFHYEGVSKEGGRSVGEDELSKFLDDWHHQLPHDPYYNPNLNQQQPYGP